MRREWRLRREGCTGCWEEWLGGWGLEGERIGFPRAERRGLFLFVRRRGDWVETKRK